MYIVGGHISRGHMDKGNVFSVPSNEYAEFNMFLDPLAAKTVFDSELDITLIPLGIQRRVGSFPRILERLQEIKTTPEAKFTHRLLSRLHRLQQMHIRYKHMVKFSLYEFKHDSHSNCDVPHCPDIGIEICLYVHSHIF